MKKKNDDNHAMDALNIATAILQLFQEVNCRPEIAYAALGSAFSRMHIGLGKNKQDWLEVTKLMADLLDEKPKTNKSSSSSSSS